MADLSKFNITPAEALLVKKVEEVIDTVNHKSDDTHLHDDRYLQLTGGTVTGAVKLDLGTDAAYMSLKRGATETKFYQSESGTSVSIDENRILWLKKLLSSNTSQLVVGTDIIQAPNTTTADADQVLVHKITEVNGVRVASTVGGRADTLGFKFSEYNLNTGAASFFGTATNATTAEALKAAVSIRLTGAVTGSVTTSLNAPVNIATTFTTIPADKITGIISIDNIPREAMPDTITVQSDEERFALTKEQAQNNDVVIVEGATADDPAHMYWVVDDTKLNLPEGYRAFTSSIATAVPWSGVLDKPATFTPSAHTQAASTITGLATIATSGSFNDLSSVPNFVKKVNDVAANSSTGNVDVTNLKVQRISSAADLNSYTTPGLWECIDSVIAAACTNCPTQLTFYLEVLQFTNDRGVRQVVTSNNPAASTMFVRTFHTDGVTSTWGPWQEVAYRGTTLAAYGITDAVKTINGDAPDNAGDIALAGIPVKDLGNFATRTITDLRQDLQAWVADDYNKNSSCAFTCSENWISLWNNETLSTAIGAGEVYTCQIIGSSSASSYTHLLISTYATDKVYTCAMVNNTWQAVHQISYADGISGAYLKLDGSSPMSGAINFSSASGLDLKYNNVSVLKKTASSGVLIGGDSSTVKSIHIRPTGIASTTNESIFTDTGTLTLGNAVPSNNNDAVPKVYMDRNTLGTSALQGVNSKGLNLNDYTQTGVYSIRSEVGNLQTNSPTVTPYTGVLEVYTTGDPENPQASDECTQVARIGTISATIEGVGLHSRKYTGGKWTVWREYLRPHQTASTAYKLYENVIHKNRDLNDIKTPGYYVPLHVDTLETLLNCPVSVPFGLSVVSVNTWGDQSSIRQELYTSSAASPKEYFRVYEATTSTWSPWKIMGEDVDMTGYVKTTSNLTFTGDNTFEGSTDFAGDLIVGSKEDPAQFIFNGEPFDNGVPIGQIFPVLDGIVPSDALPLTGGLYSRTLYSALWDWVNEHAAERLVTEEVWQATKTANEEKWVPQYSSGDGATTFRMPLWNTYTSGTSDTAIVGSYATDTQRNITGQWQTYRTSWDGGTGTLLIDPSGAFEAVEAASSNDSVPQNATDRTNQIMKFDASKSVGADHTGSEVRPKTGYVLWCVKARGGWTNVDNLDLSTVQADVDVVKQQMNNAALTNATNIFTKANVFNDVVTIGKYIESPTPRTRPVTITSSIAQAATMWYVGATETIKTTFYQDIYIADCTIHNTTALTIDLTEGYPPDATEFGTPISRVVTLGIHVGTVVPTLTWVTANPNVAAVYLAMPDGVAPELTPGAWNFFNILLTTNGANNVWVFVFPPTLLVAV